MDRGQGNLLRARLNAAGRSIVAGRMDAACREVAAFRHAVNEYVERGVLTAAQAQPLADGGSQLRSSLGCPGASLDPREWRAQTGD